MEQTKTHTKIPFPKKKSIKKRIIFAVVIMALVGLPWLCTFSGSGPSEKERAEIIETGTPATATLLSVERTGTIVNSVHQYGFVFQIAPKTGESFELNRKKLIDPLYMGNIKIGMEIQAYVNKDKDVAILWGKAGIGEAF